MEETIIPADFEDFSVTPPKPNPKVSETLYSKYVFERLRGFVLENEHGFIVWNYKAKDFFIIEFFIEESARRKGYGKELFEKLYTMAAANGSALIEANIFLADKNSSTTLLSALRCGFKVVSAINNCITIYKEVED